MEGYLSIAVKYHLKWVAFIIGSIEFWIFADNQVWDMELVFYILVFIAFILFILTNMQVEGAIKKIVTKTLIANNINVSESKAETAFPEDAKDVFPSYRGATLDGGKVKNKAQKRKFVNIPQYYGQLEDLGIKFSLETFHFENFVYHYDTTKREQSETNTGIIGDLLVIEDPKLDFGSQWIIFQSNSSIKYLDEIPIREDEYVLAKCGGRLYFGENNIVERHPIIDYFETNSHLFNQDEEIIVLLKGSQFLYCSPNVGDKPLICSPIWTPNLVEKKVNKSKRSVYLFNQLLVDISRSLTYFK